MKSHKVLLLALLVSGALTLSTEAGSNRGSSRSPAAHASVPAYHFTSGSRLNSGRIITPGQRFSTIGMRSVQTTPRHWSQPYVRSTATSSIRQQFKPATLDRGDSLTRFTNRQNRLGLIENNHGKISGTIQNRSASPSGQVENKNRGLTGRRQHVFAQRPVNWRRNWDRTCDHWWHGHRCRFINGSWFIFDLGFIPWYGYPYPYYYGYDYYPYPYGYGPGVYDRIDSNYYGQVDPNYYGQGDYGSSNQSTDSTIAAVQERLAREGYYRGEIDGVFGPETRRAIRRYQSDHDLSVSGYLTTETLRSLGLRPREGN